MHPVTTAMMLPTAPRQQMVSKGRNVRKGYIVKKEVILVSTKKVIAFNMLLNCLSICINSVIIVFIEILADVNICDRNQMPNSLRRLN